MRLFRSRADALVEQHLAVVGLHEAWWPSAKAAIAYCEQGQWFEPVMSQDGVFVARDLVAYLKLEPFVRGGVDWNAHRNPLLNDPTSRHFYDERLDSTATRWSELYSEGENPTVSDPDLHRALVYLRTLTDESPSGAIALGETGLNTVWSLGSAGYCWRLAEEQVYGLPAADYLEEFNLMWAELPRDPPRSEVSRDRLLFWGACTAANKVQSSELRPWSGCPGGFAVQFDYFEDGFALVSEGLVREGIEVSRPDLWYAWCFGFGLRDSERWLDDHPPAQT